MKRISMFAALAAVPLLAPASAQSPAGERSQVVSFADLDLASRADVRKLDRRIAEAIKQVCGAASDADPKGKNAVRRCRVETAGRLAAQRDRALAAAARPEQVALAEGR